MKPTITFVQKDNHMEANIEFVPTDLQILLRKMERLIGNYRDGQGGPPFYAQIDELSVEWERQRLPCRVAEHGMRDRFADWHS